MKRSRAEATWLHITAALCLVYTVLFIVGTREFMRRSLSKQGPPTEHDIWEGGDLVQAIRQRAQTASLYFSAFNYSMTIICLGAGLQSGLAFRQTRRIGTAVRTLFQVELLYQAIISHLPDHKTHETSADHESLNRAAHVARMGSCGIYFFWGCLGCMITFLSVFQRPLRSTVNGKDLVTLWSLSGVACAVYAGVVLAVHLGNAEWSVWQIHNSTCKSRPTHPTCQHSRQTAKSTQQPQAAANPHQVADTPTSNKSQFAHGVLRGVTCVVSVLAHMAFYVLVSLAIRGRVLAVLAGHWVLSAAAYYSVTRDAMPSMFWGFLSFMMHTGVSRRTGRKAWWVGLLTSIVFSSVGIACGVLQTLVYTFTYRYSTAEYLRGTNQVGHVALERSVGIAVACFVALDLILHLLVISTHMHGDILDYQFEVQTPTIAC